jgi:Bacterial Ig-like domain (group 3)
LRLAKSTFIPVVLLAVLAVTAPASAATDYTWSGAACPWSNPDSWVGGLAPIGSVGTLTFPYLGFGSVCYKSDNDLAGISVNAMDITGGFPNPSPAGGNSFYKIEGRQIPLGEGGITVTPALQAPLSTETDIRAPLLLSAPQTWTINGSVNGAGWLNLDGNVSGEANALQVKLNNGILTLGADLESGPISISGQGSVHLGAALGAYLIGALNGNDGNSINLGAGGSMLDENTNKAVDKNAYDLGALTLDEGTLLQLGQLEYNASVTLPVNGGISFSPTSHLSLLFNSQITATGPVNLGGASLSIRDGTTLINGAPACNVLDVDTLINTTGTLTGTFGGIPDGAVIPVPCGLPVDAVARINYTPHSAIATLLQRTSTALQVSDTTPPANGQITATATVTGERVGDGNAAGTVSFFDDGVPIPGCLAQPLSPDETAAIANCDLSFPAAGTHDITAAYSGNPTFLSSTSSTPRVIVVQPAVPGPDQGGKHGVSLLSKTILVRSSGTASLKLDCRGEASCDGTLTLAIKHGNGTTTIGTGRFSIPTGKHMIELKLNETGKRLLVRAGRLPDATLLIDGSGGAGRRRVDLVLLARSTRH